MAPLAAAWAPPQRRSSAPAVGVATRDCGGSIVRTATVVLYYRYSKRRKILASGGGGGGGRDARSSARRSLPPRATDEAPDVSISKTERDDTAGGNTSRAPEKSPRTKSTVRKALPCTRAPPQAHVTHIPRARAWRHPIPSGSGWKARAAGKQNSRGAHAHPNLERTHVARVTRRMDGEGRAAGGKE